MMDCFAKYADGFYYPAKRISENEMTVKKKRTNRKNSEISIIDYERHSQISHNSFFFSEFA
jgi:hypothetical protein